MMKACMFSLKLRHEQTGKTEEKHYKDCGGFKDLGLLTNTNHNFYFVLT
jgi:hypothetical protein